MWGVRKAGRGRGGVGRERRRCRRVGRVGRRLKGIGGSRTFGRTRGRVQTFYKYTAKCLEKKKKNEIKAGNISGEGSKRKMTTRTAQSSRRKEKGSKIGEEKFGRMEK